MYLKLRISQWEFMIIIVGPTAGGKQVWHGSSAENLNLNKQG